MNKAILITGIAGSGKSSVCEELRNQGYRVHDFENEGYCEFVDKKTGKVVKGPDENDLESIKQRKWMCDKNKLQQLIHSNPEKIVFYCGTASNINDLLPMFDKIFLLKVAPKILCERLSRRMPGAFGRMPKVQQWILSWKDCHENQLCKKGAIVIDASRSLQEIAMDIVERSKSSK